MRQGVASLFPKPSSICVFVMPAGCARGSDICGEMLKILSEPEEWQTEESNVYPDFAIGNLELRACNDITAVVAITEASTSSVESALMSGVMPRLTDE